MIVYFAKVVLVGVTSRGLVVVRLPNLTNPFPATPARPLPGVAQRVPVATPRPASTGKRAGVQP
jgi:hypothetical protein